jgi:glucosamine--fructose-6-phosphate aminotransferase (isomerizing)
VFAGESPTIGLNRRLAADLSHGGGKVAWIGDDADLDAFRVRAPGAEALPLMEILPVQMISLALATRAGREPGAFVRLSKVTTIE